MLTIWLVSVNTNHDNTMTLFSVHRGITAAKCVAFSCGGGWSFRINRLFCRLVIRVFSWRGPLKGLIKTGLFNFPGNLSRHKKNSPGSPELHHQGSERLPASLTIQNTPMFAVRLRFSFPVLPVRSSVYRHQWVCCQESCPVVSYCRLGKPRKRRTCHYTARLRCLL